MGLQMMLIKMLNFLGEEAVDTTLTEGVQYGNTPAWIKNIIQPIFKVLKTLLLPVIIVLGIAGMIYAIVIGVQYAKAENAEQKDAAKKKLINTVIGVVIMLVALIGMLVFVQNANLIFNWVETSAK